MRPTLTTLIAVALAGCATAGSPVPTVVPTGKPTATLQMDPLKVEVTRTPTGNKVEAYDAADLFAEAGAALQASKFADAARLYDKVATEFADSRYALPSLYNAGLALEGTKDFAAAATRYRKLVDKYPATKDALDALFRMGGCYAEVENWPASAAAFAELLEHQDLDMGDRIEAMARRGLAQFNMKDLRASERTFRDALAFFKANEEKERLESDFFVAMSQYYLGEIAHVEFKALPLRMPEAQLAKDLEARAELLLAAQTHYLDAVRVKDPGWVPAAGYQIATLYKEFYDDILALPVPPQLDDEAKAIYVEELHKKIEPLLRKAIHLHELTLGASQRLGVDNEWVKKSSDELERLRALLEPSHGGDKDKDKEGAAPEVAPAAPATARPPASDKMEQPPAPPTRPRDNYTPRIVL